MQLAAVDLNLLLALDALLQEGNVTRAARRVGLSQSAMSHALRRLRHLLSDPLFVRVGNTMRPTPRAQSLRQPVQEVLTQIERVLAPPVDFRPETLEREFRILAWDYLQLVLIPELVSRVAQIAPHVRLEVQDVQVPHFQERLSTGDADCAVSFVGDLDLPASIERVALFTDRLVCLVRDDLAGVPMHLDWETYASLGHLLSIPRGTEYPVTVAIDRALARRGFKRRRCLTVTGVLLIPSVLPRTDYVATVGERVADLLCRNFPLRKVYPPFRRTDFPISLLWDRRYGQDPAHAWLRSLLREAGQSLAAAGDGDGEEES